MAEVSIRRCSRKAEGPDIGDCAASTNGPSVLGHNWIFGVRQGQAQRFNWPFPPLWPTKPL